MTNAKVLTFPARAVNVVPVNNTLLRQQAGSLACDTETCETCTAEVVEGVDQNGECRSCAGSLERLLRSMAAGVSRDRKTGRFISVKKG